MRVRPWVVAAREDIPRATQRGVLEECRQGLTLVHFSAQLEGFEWDRGCA